MTTIKDPADILAGVSQQQAPEEDVPPTAIIDVDYTDKRGRKFVGRFLYKVPTLGNQVKIAAVKGALLPAGSASDPNGAVVAEILAYLTTCVSIPPGLQKPQWYDPPNAYDLTPYSQLYRRCLAHEARFHGEDPRPGLLEEPDAPEGAQLRGDDGAAPSSVEQAVPAPAQRREALTGD